MPTAALLFQRYKKLNDLTVWPILYTNIQSICSKFDELITVVQLHKPLIIFITETWLKPSIPDSTILIPGFSVYRCDSSEAVGYRGVCIFISDEISKIFKLDLVQNDWPGMDNLFLHIHDQQSSIFVGCVYRPRPCDSDSDCIQFLNRASSLHRNFLITGDFNCPDIDWTFAVMPPLSSASYPYAEFILNSGCRQLVSQPTRFRAGQVPSLLDLFIVPDLNIISDINYLPPLGKSDHSVLKSEIQLNFTPIAPRREKTLRFIDYDEVSTNLNAVDWVNAMDLSDIDSAWRVFLAETRRAVAASEQIRTTKENPLKPWIDERILKLIRQKRSLWRRFLRGRSPVDYENHRSFSNFVSQSVKTARTSYERRLVTSRNKKRLFRYVRASLNSKVSIPTVRNESGDICDGHGESANVLSTSFASSFCIEPDGNIPIPSTDRVTREISNIQVTRDAVERYLSDLKVDTAPGRDGITTRLLKNCASALAVPLHLLFTKSLTSGCIPSDWLSASITPIFKKGDKLDPSNYRPISILSSVSKVLERIVCDCLLQFCSEMRLIPDSQHGFRPNRSTTTNLLSSIGDWTRALDSGSPVDVIYLDFSKAFDRVPHRRLLAKLEHLGMRGGLLGWIKAFLTNRRYRVRVGDAYSEEGIVTSGVPQGSVLGPILFLLYTSDLPPLIRSCMYSFADDTKLFNLPLLHGRTLQDDLDVLFEWCHTWMLPLNIEKCCVLHIGKNNPKLSYSIDGHRLAPVTHHADLGVTVCSDLGWSVHVGAITARAKQVTYLLGKTFKSSDVSTWAFLYKTYIRPILEYAGQVWWPSTKFDENLLESVQRWVTRMPYSHIRPSYEERLTIFDIPSFAERRSRGDLIFTFRAMNGHFGDEMKNVFQLNTNSLRGHRLKLSREPFKTSPRQMYLPNRVFNAWNRLPDAVVESTSVNTFKNRLDEWRSH